VSGDGRVIHAGPDDPLFPWLFGSMGQLGIVFDVTLRVLPREREAPAYPAGEEGVVTPSLAPWEQFLWYTLFVPKPERENARRELVRLAARHRHLLNLRPLYAYELPFRRFHPPLLHPLQDDLVAIGIWGTPIDPAWVSRGVYADLEREFAAIVDANPSYRRYAQTELVTGDSWYDAYFTKEVRDRFLEWKRRLDPGWLLGRGFLRRDDVAV